MGLPPEELVPATLPVMVRLREVPAARVLRERLALVGDELALPPERIAAWAVARRVEEALWRADCGEVSGGASLLAEARVLADLC